VAKLKESLIVKGLSKSYGNHEAVKNLSGFSPLKPIIILIAVGVISIIVSLKTFRWD
jgi:hypothetical protein